MESSVEGLCQLLARSRLLSPEDVGALQERWRVEAGPAAGDLARFCQWLVSGQYVTQYQVEALQRGHFDHFFLNQYKLLERIGKGRMAGVYKAVHQLGQTVAIKVLPPSKAKDPELFGRFRREARLAVRLKHPNVVRTFQLGETNGLHYLVMEYLEGETLEEVNKRRGKLAAGEAARILHQAFLGLQHLHQMGLVHRDLKPANLMLVYPGDKGPRDTTLQATVKILDIGLGRALFEEAGSPGGESFQLTNEDALLGTPAYLAPEQARNAHAADIRADIYSLGCVLYEALTGQTPFPESNHLRQLIRHATEPPRPLKELNRALPDELQDIINHLLAKDPAQRYPTPKHAADALQRFLTRTAEPEHSTEAGVPLPSYLTWLENELQHEPREEQAPAAVTPPASWGSLFTGLLPVESPDVPLGLLPPQAPGPRPTSEANIIPFAEVAPSAPPRSSTRPTSPASPPSRKAAKQATPPPRTSRPAVSGPPADRTYRVVGASQANEADVERVPRRRTTAERRDATSEEGGLSRRDYLLLGIGAGMGAGGVIVAGGIGWLIARLIQQQLTRQ
jgi:serine/threonine protein kinase